MILKFFKDYSDMKCDTVSLTVKTARYTGYGRKFCVARYSVLHIIQIQISELSNFIFILAVEF